jgi:hypothetical protein
MENQGKTKQQVEDSENFTSIAIIGGIFTLLSIILIEFLF